MYGLINKAVEGFIVSKYGQTVWNNVMAESGVENLGFISMKTYPDKLTFSLVEAAAKQLSIEASKILEGVGEHFILYTSDQGYGNIMKAGGSTFPAFLKNLNTIHSRLATMMPEMIMPEWYTSDEAENSITLHYLSKRNNLDPMVVGMIKALGKRFGITCIVLQTHFKAQGADHDIFQITW